jgi:hypothetical protein
VPVGCRVLSHHRKDFLAGDLYLFVADVVSLKARHRLISKAQNIVDVYHHESALFQHAGVFRNDAREEILPAFKVEMRFIFLSDEVGWRPEAEVDNFCWHRTQDFAGIASVNLVEPFRFFGSGFASRLVSRWRKNAAVEGEDASAHAVAPFLTFLRFRAFFCFDFGR